MEYQSVLGSNNVVDLWKKDVEQNGRNKRMLQIGFGYEEGRAEKSVEMNL